MSSEHVTLSTLGKLTLKQAIAVLIEEYGFSEALDRLAELADFKAQTDQTLRDRPKWQELARTIESATEQAKALEVRLNHLSSDPDHL